MGFSLAAGGAVLVATLGSFAVVALRGSVDAPPPMRQALRSGFAFLLAGPASGIAMIVRGNSCCAAAGWSAARQRSAVLAAVGVYLATALVALAISIARS